MDSLQILIRRSLWLGVGTAAVLAAGCAGVAHNQGPVTLSAVVDQDGSVRSVTVLSGDSALAPAALEAVRQWRFKPYRVNGRATEFATRITVNFRLP